MATALGADGDDRKRLVKLAAGLPGGIGNTGFECGGITSPLLLLGLQHGLRDVRDGLPVVFEKGHAHCARFSACHGTLLCQEIRGDARVPLRCLGVVGRAPGLIARARADTNDAVPAPCRDAYRRAYTDFRDQQFHCAHAVLEQVSDLVLVDSRLLDATAGFLGGTSLQGMTCSALTAGVMVIGLRLGEIENSVPRVLRMIALMALGRDAFADPVNRFNRAMNTGNRLAQWFSDAFSSTQCRAITGTDFSRPEDVRAYEDKALVARCRHIAEAVAGKVRELVKEGGRGA